MFYSQNISINALLLYIYKVLFTNLQILNIVNYLGTQFPLFLESIQFQLKI